MLCIFGSMGDLVPALALASRLKDRGYRLSLLTHGMYEALVHDFGCSFYDIGGDPKDLMRFLSEIDHLFSRSAIKALKLFKSLFSSMFWKMYNACRKENPDLVLFNPYVLSALHVCESLSIPSMWIATSPFTETKAFSHPLITGPNARGTEIWNRLSYKIVRLSMYYPVRNVINAWRKKVGLHPMYFRQLSEKFRQMHVLYCYSQYVLSYPDDWDERYVHVCGFWIIDQVKLTDAMEKSYRTVRKIIEYRRSLGFRILLLCMGSNILSYRQSSLLLSCFDHSLHGNGCFGIVQKGWSNLKKKKKEQSFFVVKESISHDWLFSLVDGLIYHGGSGTMYMALLHGLPSIAIPSITDQYFWSKQLVHLNVGRYIDIKDLTKNRLSAAVYDILHSSMLRKSANQLSIKLKRENGLDKAVYWIEVFLKDRESL